MKQSELRQLIREEVRKLNEEYIEIMDIPEKLFLDISKYYSTWEQNSLKNYASDEGKTWSTKDAKTEILNEILNKLNARSKRKDKIIIK